MTEPRDAEISDVILYRLFKPVRATAALLTLMFAAVPAAIEALLLTSLHVPLAMAGEHTAYGGLEEGQRYALEYLAVSLFHRGWKFSLLLFSGFCAINGFLILRSRLIPRAIGVLMIAAGAGYFLNSVTAIVWPKGNAVLVPWILLPCFVGETSLALWLAIRGVNVRASAA